MNSVHDFNPFSKETIECPYDFHRALRAQEPIFEAAPGVFFVGDHALINQVLRDTKHFSSQRQAAFLNFQGEEGLAPASAAPPEIAEIMKTGQPQRDTLLSADPPEHTRYRSLVNRSLSPRRVARLEPVVRDVVTDLIDAFIDDGEVEFVSQFTALLPLTVVSLVLGVPRTELSRYKDWSARVVKVLAGKVDLEDRVDSAHANVALQNYVAQRVEEARKEPEDNLIGDLVNAHLLSDDDGHGNKEYRPLDTPEIVNIVVQLLVAGQETVNYLASSLMLSLLQNPEQMKAVTDNPELIPRMIEEGLRTESPIQSLGRFVKEDVELAGVSIPKGSRVVIMYGCGNRDEKLFADADTFDLNRDDLSKHIAFGAGPHFCVGAALARLETRVAFEELFKRISTFRLAEGKNDFTHQYNFIFRVLQELHLEFDKV